MHGELFSEVRAHPKHFECKKTIEFEDGDVEDLPGVKFNIPFLESSSHVRGTFTFVSDLLQCSVPTHLRPLFMLSPCHRKAICYFIFSVSIVPSHATLNSHSASNNKSRNLPSLHPLQQLGLLEPTLTFKNNKEAAQCADQHVTSALCEQVLGIFINPERTSTDVEQDLERI